MALSPPMLLCRSACEMVTSKPLVSMIAPPFRTLARALPVPRPMKAAVFPVARKVPPLKLKVRAPLLVVEMTWRMVSVPPFRLNVLFELAAPASIRSRAPAPKAVP
jgi:hypothetical protein